MFRYSSVTNNKDLTDSSFYVQRVLCSFFHIILHLHSWDSNTCFKKRKFYFHIHSVFLYYFFKQDFFSFLKTNIIPISETTYISIFFSKSSKCLCTYPSVFKLISLLRNRCAIRLDCDWFHLLGLRGHL